MRWYDRENVLLQVRQGNGRSSEWEAECSSNFERQPKLLLQTEQMNSLLECSSLEAQYCKKKTKGQATPNSPDVIEKTLFIRPRIRTLTTVEDKPS